MDELDREIALQQSRDALALSLKIHALRERGWLTDAQAERLIELLDSDDTDAASRETKAIMAAAMRRAAERRIA